MSAYLMGRVFYADLPVHLKVCLLALADHANDDGSGIWAGQRLLAYKVGVGDRAVRENLKTLRADGWIIREPKASFHGTDRYALVLEKLPSSEDIVAIRARLRAQAGVMPGRTIDPGGSAASPNRTSASGPNRAPASGKPSKKPSVSRPSYTADFLEIWNLYPPRNGRREKKAEAALEWAKLRPSEELRATIVRAIRALHGATDTPVDLCRYLKHRRWEDETVSGRAAAGPPPAPVAKPADGGVIARLQREGLLANGVDHAGSS